MILNHNFREKLAWKHKPVQQRQNGWKQFVGNHFAWHCLSPPACQSRIGRPPFSHVFHVPPVIGAGLSNLLSIYPSSSTSSRPPGIEAAAKGRIAPSGNAENADLVLVRAAAAAGVLWI